MKRNNPPRRQHIVQRLYLSQWTNNLTNEGFVYFEMDRNGLKRAKITNLLFQNDFYKIPLLNNDELYLVRFILEHMPNLENRTVEHYLKNFEIAQAIHLLGNEHDKKMLNEGQIKVGEELQQMGENMLTDNIREMLLKCDCSFLNDYRLKYRFLSYLFMQYLRSPKIKKQLSKNIDVIKKQINLQTINGEKVWATIHGGIAANAARQMSYKNVHLQFLVCSDNRLITCDCPVVKIKRARDLTDQFYYPLSPRIGLIISTNNDVLGIKKLSNSDITHFNNLIRANAEKIIIYKCEE